MFTCVFHVCLDDSVVAFAAAACNAISYRKRDSLCLLTGRALLINADWDYYERKGVAAYAKGFSMRPDMNNPEGRAEARRVRINALAEDLKAETAELAKVKEQATQMQANQNKTSAELEMEKMKDKQLNGDIAGVVSKTQAEKRTTAERIKLDMQTTGVDNQKAEADRRAALSEVERAKENNQTLTNARAEALAKVKLAKQESNYLMERAMAKAGMQLLRNQIEDAKNIEKGANGMEIKWDDKVKESSEAEQKQKVLENQHLIKEAQEQKTSVHVREAQEKRDIARQESEIAVAEKQQAAHTARVVRLRAKGNVESAEDATKKAEEITNNLKTRVFGRTTAHEIIVKMLEKKIFQANKNVDKLQGDLLMVNAEIRGSNQTRKMAITATNEINANELKNAALLADISARRAALQITKKEQAEAEIMRFKAHEAAQKKEAAKAGAENAATQQYKEQVNALTTTVQTAKKKLQEESDKASKIADKGLSAEAIGKAKEDYKATITQTNQMIDQLSKTERKPVILISTPHHTEVAGLQYGVDKTPKVPSAEGLKAMPVVDRIASLKLVRAAVPAAAAIAGMIPSDQAATLAAMTDEFRLSMLNGMTSEARLKALRAMTAEARTAAIAHLSTKDAEAAEGAIAVSALSPQERAATLVAMSSDKRAAVLAAMPGMDRAAAQKGVGLQQLNGFERKTAIDAMSDAEKLVAMNTLSAAQKAEMTSAPPANVTTAELE